MIRDLLARISGYPALFFACVGSGTVIPVPEDFVLLYAALKLQSGEMAWGPTLLVACSGVFLRDILAYLVGRWTGEWLMRQRWVVRMVGRRRLERARRMVEERESGAILLGRFLVGMRAPIFLFAGMAGVSPRRFLLLDGLGVLIAVPLAIGLGYVFGPPFIDGAFAVMRSTRMLTAAVLVLGAVAWWRWRSREIPEEEEVTEGAP